MDMQNIDAQVDALLTDPLTANKYLSYFDKDIKKRCIEKSEFFAQTLIHDENPEIRQLCAIHYEFLALKLIADKDVTIRSICAEKWEACARFLYQDEDVSVRWACLNWESCFPLILEAGEEDTDILRTVALGLITSEDIGLRVVASDILQNEIEEDEHFAEECLESDTKQLRLLCAQHSREYALSLIHDEDVDIKSACIEKLIEDNDWYCLGSEQLVDLCHIDEEMALLILDHHLDDWDVRSACVQLYESCTIQLMTDEDDAIAEHAKFMILESQNTKLKLNALKELNNYHIAAILIQDRDPEVRKACVEVDEDFAKALVNDNDMNVRLACLEYEDCVDDLLHDDEIEIRKACAQYCSGAIQLINDEDSEVRKVCAEHYQCALGLMYDIDDKVRETAIRTIQSNTNLSFPFE
ncbi:hypothetical protein ACG94X_07845 [Acinetobacter sp. ULE_I010]|uniref:hypothetical protein n=1 Tax=Acinetobacter sp. ULE_I010 TaxID=3373065 RepID=UPI003AF485CD